MVFGEGRKFSPFTLSQLSFKENDDSPGDKEFGNTQVHVGARLLVMPNVHFNLLS